MKIDLLLIQPVASFTNEATVLPQDAVGIGMLTIIAYVKKHGYSGKIIHMPNAFKQGYTIEKIEDEIEKCDPDIIGIGLNWLHFSEGALDTAKLLRIKYPDKIIVIGGQHATLFAKELMVRAPYITGITIGEAELTYLNMLQAVKNKKDIRGIDGFSYMQNGKYIEKQPKVIENLDDIPYYSYRWVWPNSVTKGAALDTVRGTCPKDCSYCIESKTNTLQGRVDFSSHTPQYLAGQIQFFYEEGIDSITIQDPITLMGEQYLVDVCEELINSKIKLRLLNIFVEPRIFTEKFFKLLSSCANEIVLDYGIESGADNILKISGRYFDTERLLENFRLANKYGIKILTWWMVGMPGETRQSVKQTYEFMKRTLEYGAIPRWVTPLILFPQTDMANNAEKYEIECIYKNFDDYMLFSRTHANKYGVYKALITHKPKGMSEKDIVEMTIALKKGIVKLLNDNITFLIDLGWSQAVVYSLIQEVGGSFF